VKHAVVTAADHVAKHPEGGDGEADVVESVGEFEEVGEGTLFGF
jgi:hypothetical protein